MFCVLSLAILIGLGANAVFGLSWADQLVALIVAIVPIQNGIRTWRGENCDPGGRCRFRATCLTSSRRFAGLALLLLDQQVARELGMVVHGRRSSFARLAVTFATSRRLGEPSVR
jgi:hypothetical protein